MKHKIGPKIIVTKILPIVFLILMLVLRTLKSYFPNFTYTFIDFMYVNNKNQPYGSEKCQLFKLLFWGGEKGLCILSVKIYFPSYTKIKTLHCHLIKCHGIYSFDLLL